MAGILAEIDGDQIGIWCSPLYKELVKQAPGARFRDDHWTVPLAFSACLQLRSIFGEQLAPGPKLSQWAFGWLDWRQQVEDAKLDDQFGPDANLYPFQRSGVAWVAQVRRGLLCDEMGTGKTVQLASALRYLDLPVLVICPNSMKYKWEEEIRRWSDITKISVIDGTSAKKKKKFAEESDVVIINWEALRSHSRLSPYGSVELTEKEREPKEIDAMRPATVIADEAHRAVDPKAKQTRAYWNAMGYARNRYALTGTPVVNRPADMWTIMHGIAPDEYPVRSKWVERYCNAGQGVWGWEVWGLRPETQSELFQFLDPRMLRRTKKEVLRDLPDKLPVQVRSVPLSSAQERAYSKLRDQMILEVGDEILVAADPLTLAGRLSQVAAGTLVMEDGNVVAMKRPSCKVDALFDVMAEAPTEPLVVFASSRLLIELCEQELAKKGVSSVSITGAADPQLRAARVANFQAGQAQVALCTFGAGAEGITLTRASRILFLQRSWSMVHNRQAEDRVHRIGQESPVEVIIVTAHGTIEDKVLAADQTKSGYLQEVLRDELRN